MTSIQNVDSPLSFSFSISLIIHLFYSFSLLCKRRRSNFWLMWILPFSVDDHSLNLKIWSNMIIYFFNFSVKIIVYFDFSLCNAGNITIQNSNICYFVKRLSILCARIDSSNKWAKKEWMLIHHSLYLSVRGGWKCNCIIWKWILNRKNLWIKKAFKMSTALICDYLVLKLKDL